MESALVAYRLASCSLDGFSKDGAQVYSIVRNTTGEGAEKMLAPLDLPASTDGVAGLSVAEPRLHAEPRDLVKLTTGCAVI
jgi:hypothetical protein